MRQLLSLLIAAVFFLLLSSGEAWAHPGHEHPGFEVDEFDSEAFFFAAAHPFTGLDHLLTMLVVGILACGGRGGLAVAFGGALGAGFFLGLALPSWLLALSLVPIGWLLWKGIPVRKAWVWGIVVMAGILHGGAHADGMSGLATGLGLCVGTMGGIGLGVAAAMGLRALPPETGRFAGASVAIIGVLLTFARLAL